MSDLQDLIAKNAVIAYNQGFERGEASERERIIKLLEEASDCGFEHAYNGTCFCEEITLIKGEQK